MPTLTITGGDTSNNNLTISPSAPLSAPNGSVVNWIVTGGAKITITGIRPYSDSTNIFDPNKQPRSIGNNNWQGTISSTLAVGTEEKYYIDWIVNGKPDKTYPFDPKLTISSGGER